jgi:hypothetical protein
MDDILFALDEFKSSSFSSSNNYYTYNRLIKKIHIHIYKNKIV